MSLKNVILGIAIFILTVAVVVYGISTFYPSPEYNDFCPEVRTAQYIETEQQCIDVGGKWNSYDAAPKNEVTGYCDRDYYCREDYQSAQEVYSKNVFLITLPLGIAIIVLGAFLFSLEAVGAGLMAGGVGVLLYGVMRYWSYADDWLRFLFSLAGLVLLIYFAYWFNNKNWKVWQKKKPKKK